VLINQLKFSIVLSFSRLAHLQHQSCPSRCLYSAQKCTLTTRVNSPFTRSGTPCDNIPLLIVSLLMCPEYKFKIINAVAYQAQESFKFCPFRILKPNGSTTNRGYRPSLLSTRLCINYRLGLTASSMLSGLQQAEVTGRLKAGFNTQ
jgi:hypothetical protein